MTDDLFSDIPAGLLERQRRVFSEADGDIRDNNPNIGSIPDTSEEEGIVVNANIDRPNADHRVKLSAFRGQENSIYGPNNRTSNILAPLHSTGGLLFPYTPTVALSQDTSWISTDLEHTNYDILSFQKASSASISINAKFTVQNQREGEYMMAAIHFLRTVSKAYFGEQDAGALGGDIGSSGRAGLPPPVLIFSGYGEMMFNNIRTVVRSHGWSFDDTMDMIKVDLPIGSSVWLPPMLSLSITLGMQMNTNTLREDFSLDKFRTGELLSGPVKGWF